MLMFFSLIRNIINSNTHASSGGKHQINDRVCENDEVVSCAINFYGTHLSVLRYGAKLVLAKRKG